MVLLSKESVDNWYEKTGHTQYGPIFVSDLGFWAVNTGWKIYLVWDINKKFYRGKSTDLTG